MKEPNYFLDGLKNNKENIVTEIYENSFGAVKDFVLSNNGQIEDAYDVFQKALLQITVRVRIKSISINSSFEGFLYVTCRNLWRRELNKRKKEITIFKNFDYEDEEKDLALSILEQERWEFFQKKLDSISQNCKQVLKLYFNKTPYNVIAQKLDYNSDNVVRQRVFKCKTKLIKLIMADKDYLQLKEL